MPVPGNRGIEYSKKPFKFSNTEAGFVTFKEWILDLKERHEKDKVVSGMESTGHYWFNLGKFLQDNEIKSVLVNPHHVKKSKELDDNNPTKNDRKDPKVIAGLVREGRYMIPYLPDGVYADLRTASNIRFQLQAELLSLIHIYRPGRGQRPQAEEAAGSRSQNTCGRVRRSSERPGRNHRPSEKLRPYRRRSGGTGPLSGTDLPQIY